DMSKISGGDVKAWWYDPRTGAPTSIGMFPDVGTMTFTPPSSGSGNDWILVLDDASRDFGPPGHGTGLPPPPSPAPPVPASPEQPLSPPPPESSVSSTSLTS